jgi:ribosomal protein S6--L-glutamate ligase
MKIAIISERSKSTREGSVMQQAASLLAAGGHTVDWIYPEEEIFDLSKAPVKHDLYLLKSGREAALALAAVLHHSGARILNSYPVVMQMKDKIVTTKILQAASVPLPDTWITSQARQLVPLLDGGSLVVKPYWAASQGRGVQIIHHADELAQITGETSVLFAQRYHAPEGRDHKIYAIGEQYFGVRRVWPPRTLEDKLGEPFVLTDEMIEITRNCGRAFSIDLFGLDIIVSQGRCYVVDINTFPGFKGVPDAAQLLADYLENKASA